MVASQQNRPVGCAMPAFSDAMGGAEENMDEEVWRNELPFHPGDDDAALAPHWPTPLKSAREGCDLAGIAAGDVVFDIGCGEAVCLCEIASYTSARCVGVELDHELAETGKHNIARKAFAS